VDDLNPAGAARRHVDPVQPYARAPHDAELRRAIEKAVVDRGVRSDDDALGPKQQLIKPRLVTERARDHLTTLAQPLCGGGVEVLGLDDQGSRSSVRAGHEGNRTPGGVETNGGEMRWGLAEVRRAALPQEEEEEEEDTGREAGAT
jgi:hypothetical protein